MGRFSERTKRLNRAREANAFHSFMPIAWIIGLAGFIGVGALGVDYSIHGRWEEGVFIACAVAAAVPLLVLLIRFLRGHFSTQLRDQ
jgi:hypothetical protein